MNIDVNDISNVLDIDSNTEFTNSSIKIEGCNNIVKIGYSKYKIINLNIEVRGDYNKIIISDTIKQITNLKIQSIRGGNIDIFIDENFGCGGVDIKMNDGCEKLFIGQDCLFSWGIKIRTSDGHAIIDLDSNKAVNLPSNVFISSHVWVGEDVKILKGVYIPVNCVIGGFSVVTRKFSEKDTNSVIAGFPAQVVKRGVNWDRRRADEVNNNIRTLPYKQIKYVQDNKVMLSMDNMSNENGWHTIAILEGVELNSKTLLEISCIYEKSLEEMVIQILLWSKNSNIYLWSNIIFRNQKNKGIAMIDFNKLKKVGEMEYDDVEYIEVRFKRVKT